MDSQNHETSIILDGISRIPIDFLMVMPMLHSAVPIEGFLDDYAFVIDGLLDLFTATQDSHWLQWADELQRTQDQLFWDTNPISGCYFTSVETDASILVRCKEGIAQLRHQYE